MKKTFPAILLLVSLCIPSCNRSGQGGIRSADEKESAGRSSTKRSEQFAGKMFHLYLTFIRGFKNFADIVIVYMELYGIKF